jgi:hypothetical protein
MWEAELTHWTIRLALLAYLGRYVVERQRRLEPNRRNALARGLWTTACLLLWVHVACAFQFTHGWSHARALEHTARETAAVIGWHWGGGLWCNYLVLLLWALDVARWWIAPRSRSKRALLLDRLWQGGLAFIVLNAAVVFASGPIRWISLTATGGLMLLAWLRQPGRAVPHSNGTSEPLP